jgi:hypothetical protein
LTDIEVITVGAEDTQVLTPDEIGEILKKEAEEEAKDKEGEEE